MINYETDTTLIKLTLHNFRGFKDISIPFDKNKIIVLIGTNGIGKSSILDAIGYCLSYFSFKLFNLEQNIPEVDSKMLQEDIHIEKENASCALVFKWHNQEVHIDLSIKLGSDDVKYEIDPDKFTAGLRDFVSGNNDLSIPIFSYYRSHRSKIEEDHSSHKGTYDPRVYAIHRAFQEGFSNFTGFESWYAAVHQEGLITNELNKLEPINEALMSFLNEFDENSFTDIRLVKARIKSHYTYYNFRIEIKKEDDWILLRSLSSGEKSLIFLVCDIARRLSVGNNYSTNCLNGTGIILIDEVELHLHPAWQSKILPSLSKIFPKIQFIVTTHSPLVLSTLYDKGIYIIDNSSYFTTSIDPRGKDYNSILEEILGVSSRPLKVVKMINLLLQKLALENKLSPESERLFREILDQIGSDDPLIGKLRNKIILLK